MQSCSSHTTNEKRVKTPVAKNGHDLVQCTQKIPLSHLQLEQLGRCMESDIEVPMSTANHHRMIMCSLLRYAMELAIE